MNSTKGYYPNHLLFVDDIVTISEKSGKATDHLRELRNSLQDWFLRFSTTNMMTNLVPRDEIQIDNKNCRQIALSGS